MTGTTTGQTSLATDTDSDDVEHYLTVDLASVLQTLANLFESATGHAHAGSGQGKPITSAGIASGVHLTAPVVDSGGLAITLGNLAVNTGLSASAGIAEGSTALTGTTQIGIQAGVAGTSGATAEVAAFRAIPQTAAAAFTSAEVTNFHATNPIKGAGSTITAATGLTVDSITVGGTKNIGVRVNPPSGATVNAGANIGGDVILGGAALSSALATNAVVGFVWIPYSAGAPTGTPSGFAAALDYTGRAPMQFDTTNNKLWVHNGTAWKGVVLA